MSDRLYILFIILALLAGAALTQIDGSSWQRPLTGVFALLLGLALLSLALRSVQRGDVRGARGRIARSGQPEAFWFVVVVYLAAAALLVTAGLWFLLFL